MKARGAERELELRAEDGNPQVSLLLGLGRQVQRAASRHDGEAHVGTPIHHALQRVRHLEGGRGGQGGGEKKKRVRKGRFETYSSSMSRNALFLSVPDNLKSPFILDSIINDADL